jgi:hypothetical protein
VEAQFLSVHDGKIRLHKINGVKIDVPMEKMCVEDIRYIEQETDAYIGEDKSDNMPLAHLAKETGGSQRSKSQGGSSKPSWDWFDYFMRANVPMQESLRYSSAFQAENLGEGDLQNLTHRRMKALGLSEKHVQRLQRFIESDTPEPASDDEAASAKKAKGKRNVSFGATSVIGEGLNGSDGRQAQIEEDERLARELQEQEDHQRSSPSIFKKEASSSGLQRRGTSRPTPTNSAPKGINADIFELMKGQLSSEPLKPTVASPLPKQSAVKVEPAPPVPSADSTKTQTKPSGGFEDDAWAPRQSSPAVAKKVETAASPAQPSWKTSWAPTQPQASSPAPALNTVTIVQPSPNVQAPPAPAPPPPPPLMSSIQQQQPVISSPARQRPIPKQTQESKVNPQVFNQWSSPAKAPVSQQSTGMMNQNNVPGNFQATPVQMQMNIANSQQTMNPNMQQPQFNNQQQRPFLAPQNTGFVPQQQQQQFMSPANQPQLTGMQRPQSMMVNNMMTGQGLQPNQGIQQTQGFQPGLIPANTGVNNMLQPQQNMQQFQTLQPQQTGFNTLNNNIGRSNSAGNLPNMAVNAQPTGLNPQPTGQRSWANATPDNPFGAGQQTPQVATAPFNQTSPLQQQQNMFSAMGAQTLQPQQTGFIQQPQQTGFGNGMMGANAQGMDRSFSGPTFGSNGMCYALVGDKRISYDTNRSFSVAAGDKYSIFKAVDPSSPSVFTPGQPQQQSKYSELSTLQSIIDSPDTNHGSKI